jgi:hypothetical protein
VPSLATQPSTSTTPTLSRRHFTLAALVTAALPRLSISAEPKPREVPWLAEVQTPPADIPAGAPSLAPLLVDAQGKPITTLDAWRQQRGEILARWRKFLGVWKEEPHPPRIEVLAEDVPEQPQIEDALPVVRQRIRYENEPGTFVEAYLLKPRDNPKPRPAVVILHSTANHTIRQGAGLEGKPQEAWGLKLARRGMVAICPRCFLWNAGEPYDFPGEVKKFHDRHPGSKGMAKMLYDAQRAIDVLETLPEVDRTRIGAGGHSLGAKETLYVAAFDDRIKASVSSEGGIGIRFSNWNASWYLGPAVDEKPFTADHHELLALIAPRPFLLLGGDSADGKQSWPFIAAALPVYELHGKPARLGLFNHQQGHSIPPLAERRTYEWLEMYL